jgi:hypothetical protein
MFYPRQLFRALNRCRPSCRPRWLSTVQHDSSNILPDPQPKPIIQNSTHTNFTMRIMASVNSGNTAACFRAAVEMKAAGVAPDILTYNALMSAVAQDASGLLSWAIFDDMLLVGIQPTVTTFTYLMEVIMSPFTFKFLP